VGLTWHGADHFGARPGAVALRANAGHAAEAGVGCLRDPIPLAVVLAPGVVFVGPEALVRVAKPFFPGATVPRRRAALRIRCFHEKRFLTRVARFFLVQFPNTGENVPKYQKYTKQPSNRSNGRKIDQMSIIYTNIFQCKALRNLPKLGFLF
jgi:hypothetical protein